jgi:hypothetical protein
MFTGKLVVAQLMDFLPLHPFRRSSKRGGFMRETPHKKSGQTQVKMPRPEPKIRPCTMT